MKNLIVLTLILIFSITSLNALNPSRTYKQRPEKYNMEYNEDKVPTKDGKATLNAWVFLGQPHTGKTILLVHNGEGNMADYLDRVKRLTDKGYNVVIFDYRGFGESSDFAMDNNMYIYPHFTDDLESMIDYCRKEHSATFDIYGWGIGAGLALGIGWNRAEVKRIIADTPFLSMEDLEERFSEWDEPMEVPFAGYDRKYEPIHALEHKFVGKTKAVLIIIGSNDILFKKEDMEKLKNKRKKEVNDIHVVENPHRKDNFKVNQSTYINWIDGFLKSK